MPLFEIINFMDHVTVPGHISLLKQSVISDAMGKLPIRYEYKLIIEIFNNWVTNHC